MALSSTVFGQPRVRQLLRRARELQQQRGAGTREGALVDQHLNDFLKVSKNSVECEYLAMLQTAALVSPLVLSTPSK